MKLILLGILPLLVLVGCAGTLSDRAAQSCPASIPAPLLQIGDTWRWQDEKGEKRYRRYVRKTEDGLFENESRTNAPKYFYDDAHTLRKIYDGGQWITSESVRFPHLGKPALDFPLQSGKSWSYMVNARSVDGTLLTYRETYSVRGCEEIQVPAGTFFAVVIEEEQAIIGTADRGSRMWWYAPEVKYFIKLTHGHASHPGFWTRFRDWVLISYQVTPPKGGPAAPAPTAP
jgi:hypothetical protein